MNNIITINDPKYPKLLKETSDPPKQLYYRGNFNDSIFENCLAVVGSRRMTTYGKQITQKLVSEIANKGITIASGFMYGIDATAHSSALNIGGRTIAVMPCGINLVHPEHQVKLYDDILENNGLIISEYYGDFLPANWTYPRRNRIVAGISKATLIVEAGERSGSLITANFAKKFKRKVFVVPSPLTSSLSKGISQLIKQGAEVITCANDVLEYYNIRYPISDTNVLNQVKHNKRRTLLEEKIIQELQKEPMEIDILARNLNISVVELGTKMSLMEIKEIIFNENGKYYVC